MFCKEATICWTTEQKNTVLPHLSLRSHTSGVKLTSEITIYFITVKNCYSYSSIHPINKPYHDFEDTNWRKAEVLKCFMLKVKRGERQRNEKSSEWDTDTMGSRVVPSGVGPLNNSLSHPITPELPHLYPLHTHPHRPCHRCTSALWGSRH